MKKIFLLPLFLILATLANSQPAIQQFVNNPALKHASAGVQVTDLKTGKTIVSHDPQKSLTPASITKVITSATALELLGSEYRYVTQVALDESGYSGNRC